MAIKPFKEFLDDVSKAKLDTLAPHAATKVKESSSLEEMRNHILSHYKGVEVQHSFVDANGSVFDCVPVEQQPSLQGKGAPAKAPDLPMDKQPAGATDDRKAKQIEAPLGAGKKDSLGNAMECPDGTIPLRRLRLEDMSRFENLHQFFQKSPVGNEVTPPKIEKPTVATHRWAHAFQNVNNLGGHSYLNVWDPAIGANQIFSLSQHWYVGSSSAGTQTAECGLQVYPGLYGNTHPCLFIYWTADGYNKTGCYNLSCNAFTQTNKNWTLGGAVGPISIYGGQQYELFLAYYLSGGLWWFYVGGGAAANAIGYYKASQYGSGTMATHAVEIDYGGETVGTTSWPGMGSGHFANQGWQKASYQRDIESFPTTGGAVIASLTPSQQWPQCYTATVTKFNPPWNETLFFGGPGGTNC
jgi:hypothetical protein